MSGEDGVQMYQIAEWRLVLLKLSIVLRWIVVASCFVGYFVPLLASGVTTPEIDVERYVFLVLVGLTGALEWIAYIPDGTQPDAESCTLDKLQLYWIIGLIGGAAGLIALLLAPEIAGLGTTFARYRVIGMILLISIGFSMPTLYLGYSGFKAYSMEMLKFMFPPREMNIVPSPWKRGKPHAH